VKPSGLGADIAGSMRGWNGRSRQFHENVILPAPGDDL